MADLLSSLDQDEQNKNTAQPPGSNFASQFGGGTASPDQMQSSYDSVFGSASPQATDYKAPSAPQVGPQGPSGSTDMSHTPGQSGPELNDAWAQASYSSGSSNNQTTPAPAPSPDRAAATSANSTQQYSDLVSKLGSTNDPQQKAMLQDQLARNVFGTLKGAGHDVKWQGDQLIVDGRPYVVGSGDSALPGGTAGAPAAPPDGFDPGQQVGHDGSINGMNREAYRDAWMSSGAKSMDDLQKFVAAHGGTVVSGNGTVMTPFGEQLDMLANARGSANGQGTASASWGGVGGGAPAPGAGGDRLTPDSIASVGPHDLGAAGVPTGGGSTPGAPGDPGWSPTAPTYTPGAVDNSDLQGFRLDENMGRLGPGTNVTPLDDTYQAGQVSNDPLDTYSFGGFGPMGDLGAGRTDQQTEDLVSSILQNPESLDPRTVEMMKAKSKDELADMQRSEDDDLTAAGYRTGNADSNWLQSEKLASKGRRDNALVSSNRAIDLDAAQTNAADRRAAAGVGQSYADSKNSRNLANRGEQFTEKNAAEGLTQASVDSKNKAAQFKREGEVTNEQLRGDAFDRRTKVAQQNIENQFRSTAEKQTAFKLAADTALAASSQKGDRMAFEEQIKQKATELGQSADTIRQNYVLGLLHDATTKYGIDVGASIDRAKLSQAGVEFQQDLAFRLQQLAQQDRQFGASYGLDAARLTLDANNSAYDHYKDTFGD